MDQDGFNVELDGLLKRYGKIYRAAYHGGDLNGVCCLRLVENQQEIIEKIREMCERRRNQRTNGQPCSIDKLDGKITLYSQLFESIDTAFAYLRTVAPTDDEYVQTEISLSILEQLWFQVGLSETPKAHILFNHAASQQKLLEGLGDKGEDFVELAHQQGLRLEHIMRRMAKKYEGKQNAQLAIEWKRTNPTVEKYCAIVRNCTRRKRKETQPLLKDARQNLKKKIKQEKREAFIDEWNTQNILTIM